jgi:cytochrome c oxidase subunit 3/cytochrome o ubiquinol oxidase subunit 3
MSEAILDRRGLVGMWCLIAAESAIFTIFVVAYLFYLGKSLSGPRPQDVLQPPVLLTICLLSSSLSVHLGVKALTRGDTRAFVQWWVLTLVLGAVFLAGTALEWRRLIYVNGLTIQTNLFGTTYFSLVGLHAFHVTVGLIGLALASVLGLLGFLTAQHAKRTEVFSLYWHFVDAVWVVVFSVVYLLGRS